MENRVHSGLSDGILPDKRAVLANDIDGERRVLFVGATRAKSVLILTRYQKSFGRNLKKSRFLYDKKIMRSLVERMAAPGLKK